MGEGDEVSPMEEDAAAETASSNLVIGPDGIPGINFLLISYIN